MLKGLRYTQNTGGASIALFVKVKRPGVLYVGIQERAKDEDIEALEDMGFEKTGMSFNYSDSKKTTIIIYKAVVTKDFKMPKANSWSGFILIY